MSISSSFLLYELTPSSLKLGKAETNASYDPKYVLLYTFQYASLTLLAGWNMPCMV